MTKKNIRKNIRFDYKTLLLIMLVIVLLVIFFNADSIPPLREMNSLNYRLCFDKHQVTIEPNISCLSFQCYWAQGAYDVVWPTGCYQSYVVNNKPLKGTFPGQYTMLYINGEVVLEMNNLTLIANKQNNFTLEFTVVSNATETYGKSSVVKIPIVVEKGPLIKVLS